MPKVLLVLLIVISFHVHVIAGTLIPSDSTSIDSGRIAAPRPPIAKGASSVVHLIDQDFLTNLPSRGIDAAILLQPGVMPLAANRFGEPLIAVRGGREGDIGYRIEDVPANDLIWSGRSVTVTAEAVEQMQVHAGGPAAEFGGGGSGLVGMQLRTGRPDRWGGSLLAETDRYTGMSTRSLGGYSYGYSDWTATAGGPFPGLGDALRLFGSVQNTFFRDPTVSVRSGYNFSGANAVVTLPVVTPYHSTAKPDTLNIVFPDGNAPGGSDNRWTMTGTALLDLSPARIRIAGSYSYDRGQNPAGLDNILNQSRLPLNIAKDGFVNARVTHEVSPSFSYEAGFSYSGKTFVTEDPQLLDNIFAYGDPGANAALGYTLNTGNGQPNNWPAYVLWNGAFSLNQPGTQVAGYEKTSQESYGVRAGVTIHAGIQEIRAGGEYTQYTTREFTPSNVFYFWYERNLNPSPASLDLVLARNSTGIGYGYDVYGREINADDVRGGELYSLGPRKPLIWGGYIQDRIDLTVAQITLGLRYDFIDPGAKDLANPYAIQVAPDGLLLSSQIISDATTSQFSPRIGLALPLSDRVILHGQVGRFLQEATTFGGGMNCAAVSEGEAGVSALVGDLFSFDITGFYKSITHQIGMVLNPGYLIPVQFPVVFLNGGISSQYQFIPSTVDVYPKGVEFALTLQRTSRLAAQINYTLQTVNTDWFNSVNQPRIGGGPIYITQAYESAIEHNATHHGSVLLDYRFGKDDGGPVLEQSGINLVLKFHSGYTVTGVEPQSTWTTPGFAQIDGRIDKIIPFGPLSIDLYIYAINLFGADNAVIVFPRTGDPANDGWLSSPSGAFEASQNGPQYVAMYNAVNEGKNSGNWGPPRQIRFGARVEF